MRPPGPQPSSDNGTIYAAITGAQSRTIGSEQRAKIGLQEHLPHLVDEYSMPSNCNRPSRCPLRKTVVHEESLQIPSSTTARTTYILELFHVYAFYLRKNQPFLSLFCCSPNHSFTISQRRWGRHQASLPVEQLSGEWRNRHGKMPVLFHTKRLSILIHILCSLSLT